MQHRTFIFLIFLLFVFYEYGYTQERTIVELSDWRFSTGDFPEARYADFDDSGWEQVRIPHDWAIKGPFDEKNDKQIIRIIQNGEEVATLKRGRTGALPHIGVGWYRTTFFGPDSLSAKDCLIQSDGAMSQARVYVNGAEAGFWPYGYAYFYFDISKHLTPGQENVIAIRLENLPQSSRWYPGAGLYRKVRLIFRDRVSFELWGNRVSTLEIGESMARLLLRSKVPAKPGLECEAEIYDPKGRLIKRTKSGNITEGAINQEVNIANPHLWAPESPQLYTARFVLSENGRECDSETIRFGIRTVSIAAGRGFELNGKPLFLKGVCLHHDLGPLGAAVNRAALRRQLLIMKEMGANAIRTAHNMPAPQQVELCDELGILVIAESFDEWQTPKMENGYHLWFDEWAVRDVRNLVRVLANHPSVVLWSAGNEVPDQWTPEGLETLRMLQETFHDEDPTRWVTVGMDQVKAVMENGFAAAIDVPGLNYRVHLYEAAYETFPQGFLLGSETASTVSSRGVYHLPAVSGFNVKHPDLQCSSYDLEYCSWSNLPDVDFLAHERYPWLIGQFVWTGFDYLGEPTPYDAEWPARSSYFGICDLAGIPKDRYWLYRSVWNEEEPTLHILPHWNWENSNESYIPVFVYTNYPKAELFLNGKSLGIREKSDQSLFTRYRLIWEDVPWEPGVLQVVALDSAGNRMMADSVVTAGNPAAVKLEADRTLLSADGEDLAFITVTVTDQDGNPCPRADNLLEFYVSGAGSFEAVCNGDPTSLRPFHLPLMEAFSGKLVVIVRSGKTPGDIRLEVKGKGIKTETITLRCR
ncbi:MAG: beta-galactosidase GalB [Bacteroidales bacterium]